MSLSFSLPAHPTAKLLPLRVGTEDIRHLPFEDRKERQRVANYSAAR
jgi:hypothetical protein